MCVIRYGPPMWASHAILYQARKNLLSCLIARFGWAVPQFFPHVSKIRDVKTMIYVGSPHESTVLIGP